MSSFMIKDLLKLEEDQPKVERAESVAGCKRRLKARTVFTHIQRFALEQTFKDFKFLAYSEREKLSCMLGLSENQVKTWFQNRRSKWKKKHPVEAKRVLTFLRAGVPQHLIPSPADFSGDCPLLWQVVSGFPFNCDQDTKEHSATIDYFKTPNHFIEHG